MARKHTSSGFLCCMLPRDASSTDAGASNPPELAPSREEASVAPSPSSSPSGSVLPVEMQEEKPSSPEVAPPVNVEIQEVAAELAPPAEQAPIRSNPSSAPALRPEEVQEVSAFELLNGLKLSLPGTYLGRGTYGVVLRGALHGVPVAVKLMLSQSLDRAALREVLVGPRLAHPNVIQTYATRCARLTDDYFDWLEGPRHNSQSFGLRRLLQPLEHSGEGFGDPLAADDGLMDPVLPFHQALYLLQAGVSQMVVLIIMELADQATLSDAIHKGVFSVSDHWGARLAARAMLRTVTEICRALGHLHEAGVVHGDLKPANVLLKKGRDDRRGFTVKVGDFGLSHLVASTDCSHSTNTWGSVAYMAPEAFQGRVSRATDVWSFGVLLWEMVNRSRPFGELNQGQVISGVQDGSLSLAWPMLPPPWDPNAAAAAPAPVAIAGAPQAAPAAAPASAPGVAPCPFPTVGATTSAATTAGPRAQVPSVLHLPQAARLMELGQRCMSRTPAERPGFTELAQRFAELEAELRRDGMAQQQAARRQVPYQRQAPYVQYVAQPGDAAVVPPAEAPGALPAAATAVAPAAQRGPAAAAAAAVAAARNGGGGAAAAAAAAAAVGGEAGRTAPAACWASPFVPPGC